MKDSFYTNVLKMFMGTTGAYIFWALAMLIVGRFYTPEYFGGGTTVHFCGKHALCCGDRAL